MAVDVTELEGSIGARNSYDNQFRRPIFNSPQSSPETKSDSLFNFTPQGVQSGLASGTFTGLGAATGNPWAMAGGAAIDLVNYGINAYKTKQANARRLKRLKAEQVRQRAIEAEQARRARMMEDYSFEAGQEDREYALKQRMKQDRISSFQNLMNAILQKSANDNQLKEFWAKRGYV